MESLSDDRLDKSQTMPVSTEEEVSSDLNSSLKVDQLTKLKSQDDNNINKNVASDFNDTNCSGVSDNLSVCTSDSVQGSSSCSKILNTSTCNNLEDCSNDSNNFNNDSSDKLNNMNNSIKTDGNKLSNEVTPINSNENIDNEILNDESSKQIDITSNESTTELRLEESNDTIDEDDILKDTDIDNQVLTPKTNKDEDSSTANDCGFQPETNVDSICSANDKESVENTKKDTCNDDASFESSVDDKECVDSHADQSVAGQSVTKEHDNSNPPLGTDETSFNLSETGGGSGSECERTRFLQCDGLMNQDEDNAVMDVIEVNAVDPFAATVDAEQNELSNDMDVDVDESKETSGNVSDDNVGANKDDVESNDVSNMKKVHDLCGEGFATPEHNDTNENKSAEIEMDVSEDQNNSMDITEAVVEKVNKTIAVQEDMDTTKAGFVDGDVTLSHEKPVEERNRKDDVPSHEKTVVEEEDMDTTKAICHDSDANTSNEKSVKDNSGKDEDPLQETNLLDKDKDIDSSSSENLLDKDKDIDSSSSENKNDNSKSIKDNIEKDKSVDNETSLLKEPTTNLAALPKDDGEKSDKQDDVVKTGESSSDSGTKSDKNPSVSGQETAEKPSRAREGHSPDEDVCIIPDADPSVPENSSSINGFNKLRSILKRNSSSNIINVKTDSPVVSTRPQRQAAKIAGAQIKAAVLLDDDDVEKENDEVEESSTSKVDSDSNASRPPPNGQTCQQCCKVRTCKFKILSQGKTLSYLCSEICSARYQDSLKTIQAERARKADKEKREGNSIDNPPNSSTEINDASVIEKEMSQIKGNEAQFADVVMSVEDDNDSDVATTSSSVQNKQTPANVATLLNKTPHAARHQTRRLNDNGEFIRICCECSADIKQDERTLSWETMDFCNEGCLGKYQTSLGSFCAYCKKSVQQLSLGKYCVRFGYNIRQFCCASCLEEFKKGLKVCSYCQIDISSSVDGFLAPVGDKGQFKYFCTQACLEKYDQMSSNHRPPPQMHPCDVCKNKKVVQVEVLMDSKVHKMCSEVCFAAFKFVNTITVDQCDMCRKYFDHANCTTENYSVYYEDVQHNFCCKTCMNVYILAKRKIVPCNWCKVKKYNFDMIKRVMDNKQVLMMCSLNCLTLYQVSINAVSSRRIKCDNRFCTAVSQAQYHLTMSDATIRNFCTYNCVMKFQVQFNKSPITLPNNQQTPTGVPVISSVTSLAIQNSNDASQLPNGPITGGPIPVSLTTAAPAAAAIPTPQVPPQPGPAPGGVVVSNASTSPYHVIVRPSQPPRVGNKMTQCKALTHTKGVSCRPHACAKETQTDHDYCPDGNKVLIPVPVPIYIPVPMHMFTLPIPTPMPMPLPLPVPIFIPTTRNSAKGIMQEIKKIQEKIPADPFEAELLMMAEMVAEEKKQDETSSESGDDAADPSDNAAASSSTADNIPSQSNDITGTTESASFTATEVIETNSNTFGAEDMLQMALKMANELDDQSNSSTAVDLEAELPPSTITPAPPSVGSSRSNHTDDGENEEDVDDPEPVVRESRTRKRAGRPPGRKSNPAPPAKRPRKSSSNSNNADTPTPPPLPPAASLPEKPDANLCLKFTFGVNAWKQWVTAKNTELEKLSASNSNNRKAKLFKTDILQLTADELNYSLCLFVKEARKPNGSSYAPDTIYYFCLGIQQYLFENGRIDNIFTDAYYEKFTECLDDVAKVFSEVSDDSKLIVTRVEEEHLWESKQLGAHSPHVLLSTLMFFNTKHFDLTTVDEHAQLSFSHIMKHWKRNPNQTSGSGSSGKSTPGNRNVLLRFYPPQTSDSPKKKKVYEQQENIDNPLRCPVKLYEFYLSKCPESVKTRNDVFYLLPERSCVPDSPVWYSTMALKTEPLLKMLHRIKMVKEVNIALRSS